MTNGIDAKRPEWAIELLCEWLDRRIHVVSQIGEDNPYIKWKNLIPENDYGTKTISISLPEAENAGN